jgi:hypothetical protein
MLAAWVVISLQLSISAETVYCKTFYASIPLQNMNLRIYPSPKLGKMATRVAPLDFDLFVLYYPYSSLSSKNTGKEDDFKSNCKIS